MSRLALVLRTLEGHSAEFLIVAVSYAISLVLATLVIRVGLRRIKPRVPASRRPAVGFWIGAFEAILVFVFVFRDAFSALAIIFAAKEYVRREKVAKDPAYYLLGTLVNVAIAMLFAILAALVIEGTSRDPAQDASSAAPAATEPLVPAPPAGATDSTAGPVEP